MSIATDNQAALAALTTSASKSAIEAWGAVEPDTAARSWGAQLPAVIAGVTTAQIAAAGLAQPYVAAVTAARAAARGTVVPSAFGGVASDGRTLPSLLFQPALAVIIALGLGSSSRRALAAGRASLDMIVRTQVADANRLAAGVAMAVEPEVTGYERVVHLPACGRCIVLAGRLYRWSTGFLRHPRCDCTMHPVTRAEHESDRLDNHPAALFTSMTTEQQDAALGIANAAAVRAGADLGQVVNARRGMATAGSSGHGPRPTPEQIFTVARGRRATAVDLLRQYGYII